MDSEQKDTGLLTTNFIQNLSKVGSNFPVAEIIHSHNIIGEANKNILKCVKECDKYWEAYRKNARKANVD